MSRYQVAVPGLSPVLTFRQNRNLESSGEDYYDGGVLEIVS